MHISAAVCCYYHNCTIITIIVHITQSTIVGLLVLKLILCMTDHRNQSNVKACWTFGEYSNSYSAVRIKKGNKIFLNVLNNQTLEISCSVADQASKHQPSRRCGRKAFYCPGSFVVYHFVLSGEFFWNTFILFLCIRISKMIMVIWILLDTGGVQPGLHVVAIFICVPY